jgi:hypothetical protein
MSIVSKKVNITVQEIALIAMTRVVLGIGAGLLLSNALKKNARRAVGLSLLLVGAATTVPLALRIRDELH